MCKYLLLLCLTAAVSRAAKLADNRQMQAVATPRQEIGIVSAMAEKRSDGSYIYAYESADGSYREEVGIVRNAGSDDEELDVFGAYRYTAANGELIEVRYTADKYGFVPEGNSIAPAISQAAMLGVKTAKLEAS